VSTLAANTQPAVLPRSLSCLNPIVVEDLRRYGRERDGGYLLPASRVSEIDGIISLGILDDWSFEEDLSRIRPGIPIHAYDHTVGAAFFRREVSSSLMDILMELREICLLRATTSNLNKLIERYQERRAVYSGYRQFFPKRAVHYEQRVFNRREVGWDATIDDIFARLKGKSHLLLKMDIEGAEYRVLPQILERSEYVDLLVIEFHDTEPLRDLFLKHIHEILAHFQIIHVHSNNNAGAAPDGLPEALEISFLSRKFPLDPRQRRNRLPIEGLDMANEAARPDLPPLIFC
jgi:Methyltransferase FkbM domain